MIKPVFVSLMAVTVLMISRKKEVLSRDLNINIQITDSTIIQIQNSNLQSVISRFWWVKYFAVSWNSVNNLCYFTILVINNTWFQWFELLLSYNFERGPQCPSIKTSNSLQFFYANIFILLFVLLKYFYRILHIGFLYLAFWYLNRSFQVALRIFFLSLEKKYKINQTWL